MDETEGIVTNQGSTQFLKRVVDFDLAPDFRKLQPVFAKFKIWSKQNRRNCAYLNNKFLLESIHSNFKKSIVQLKYRDSIL